MHIPYLKSSDTAFDRLPEHHIACCNWPETFPATPKASFRIFHDGENLHINYRVDEPGTAAATTDDNGPVWLDSCVEFFIAPDDAGYYNFELNCIGALLIGYRDTGGKVTHAPTDVLTTVLRHMSLPRLPFKERHTGPWTGTLVIPATALFKHKIKHWSGMRARVNFYKCGDNLSVPHYLSWAPIDWPTPNFHLPQFFADADFE